MGALAAQPAPSLLQKLSALSAVATLFLARVPYYVVTNLLPSHRPDKRWSFKRAFFTRMIRWVMFFRRQYPYVLVDDPAREPDLKKLELAGVGYERLPVWQGEVRGWIRHRERETGVGRVKVPVYWFGAKAGDGTFGGKAKEGERVVLSFHGGAYTMGSASPDLPTSFASIQIPLLSRTIHRVAGVEYRLSDLLPSGGCVNPFPAAFLDALSVYHHVLSLGFTPSNIYLMGDSAGGNIILALCRYLLEEEDIQVGGLILLSPWVDISYSHSGPGFSRRRNLESDYVDLTLELENRSCVSFLGGMAPEHPYISPACTDIEPPSFEGFPRTYIGVGEVEMLVDEAHTLKGRMEPYLKGKGMLVLDVVPAMPHDFSAFSFFEPERSEFVQRIVDWLDAE